MGYLALSDLDNTLLTADKIITKESIEYIKEWINEGNMFSIATGRPYSGTYKYYQDLGLDSPMICDNGGSIYFINGENKFFSIPLDIFKDFLSKVEEYASHIYVTTTKNICYSYNLDLVPSWLIHDEIDDLKIVEGKISEIIVDEPLICNFWCKPEFYKKFLKVCEKYEDIKIRDWCLHDGAYAIEIRSIDASKGNALKYVSETFNIGIENTIAFGDEKNDISMIQEAHYGICMINACEELKAVSNYETTYDYNNNGVIEFLKSFE